MYESMRNKLHCALRHLSIIAGDIVGDSDKTWQDHAALASASLRALADRIDRNRRANAPCSFPVFPSPSEELEQV